MLASGTGLVAQRLSRLHLMWEDAGSNPAGPVLSTAGFTVAGGGGRTASCSTIGSSIRIAPRVACTQATARIGAITWARA